MIPCAENGGRSENSYSPQSYTYDAWGRLKIASTAGLEQNGSWQLQWDYDRFGNRRNQTMTGGVCTPGVNCPPQPQLNISETTNRITDAGFAYDNAGNMTNDAIHTFTYDAENRIKTLDGTAATYTYASGPLRIKKVVGAATTVYIFSGSKVIAEYVNGALSKEYVYAGSQLLATVAADGTRTYHHPDHLSVRADTNADGAMTRSYGHYPFGETWYEEAPQGQTLVPGKWKFTSYERDSESGLDQAIFRYDSSRLGRFMSPDPLGGFIQNPQSLNRYAYALKDPINLVDPLGLRQVCHDEVAWVMEIRVVPAPPSGPGEPPGEPQFEVKWVQKIVPVCSEIPDPPKEPRDPHEPDDKDSKEDPGDPNALQTCIDAANRDYLKEWERSRKVTGLGEGLKKIGEHLLIEKVATYIYPPAGLAAAFGYLVYEEYGSVSEELRGQAQMEENLTTRKENCGLAFGPRKK